RYKLSMDVQRVLAQGFRCLEKCSLADPAASLRGKTMKNLAGYSQTALTIAVQDSWYLQCQKTGGGTCSTDGRRDLPGVRRRLFAQHVSWSWLWRPRLQGSVKCGLLDLTTVFLR